MTGETLGGHIIRSLEKSLDGLEKATKKDRKEANKEADKLEAELDRLLELLGDDTLPYGGPLQNKDIVE